MLAYEGHLGVTWGSLWNRSGATWGPFWAHGGDFSSLWHHYGMIVESLWVKEVRFQKKFISPKILMIFHLIVMILWSSGVNLEQFGGHFGAPWAHFEVTLAQAGRSWRQVGPKLAQLGPKFGPKRAHKQNIFVLSNEFWGSSAGRHRMTI